MQQVVRRRQPRLVATSVSTILAVINDVCHIPFAIVLKYGGTVYLVVIVGGSHDKAVFIGCAHLVKDALHGTLRDDVGGKTADNSQEHYECDSQFFTFHVSLFTIHYSLFT